MQHTKGSPLWDRSGSAAFVVGDQPAGPGAQQIAKQVTGYA